MNRNMLDLAGMKILTSEKMKLIHNASLTILEEVGVKIHDPEALALLDGLGAYVGDHNIVRIPSHLVEAALRTAPKKITLYDRGGQPSMVLEDRNIYFGSNLDCLKYLDPYSGRVVDFTTDHMVGMARIGDYFNNFSFVYCIGMMTDCETRLASRIAFKTALLNTGKTINFATNDADSCADIIQLAAAIAGGGEALKRKPFIFHYAEPIPPLNHNQDSLRRLIMCAAAGVPIVYMPYCMMGATAPVTFAGALAQSNAEILSGLVIHQARQPGAPFIVGNMPSTMDMRSTIGTYGAPEFHMMVAAASELAHYYGLPFYGTCGCSDAKRMDHQAVMEASMSVLTSLLSTPNVVHDPGFMDHGNSISPEIVVLTSELIDMLKVVRQGITVNAETLALDVIREVGPGGHYLGHEHTHRHFRSFWDPAYFDRSREDSGITVNQKINAKTREIMENHRPVPLDDAGQKLVAEFEKQWRLSIY